MKKLILEKNDSCGTKILMSGGSRCNVSNMNINFLHDYVGENVKSLPSVFHKFNNHDMVDFLNSNGIKTVVEDNGRILLKSGKARQLLDLLLALVKKNKVQILVDQNIIKVKKKNNQFLIKTENETFVCDKLIVAT
jgi:hypothetical protein